MKFKLIFLIFNGIILFSFFFVFLMPLFVLGFQPALQFWGQNWFLFLFFVGMLGVLDGYFFSRWHFFRLLESENWEGLSAWLDTQVFQKGRLGDQNVRFLFRSWLIQGKVKESARLEALIREKKPSRLPRHARMLGLNHLLANDPEDLKRYYGAFGGVKGNDGPWLKFGLALGHAGSGDAEGARKILLELACQKKDRLLQLVSLYMLAGPSQGEESRELPPELAGAHKDFILATGRQDLRKLRESRQDDLELLVLSKLLDSAQDWVYSA